MTAATLRGLVPRGLRVGASVALAHGRAVRLERRLAALAAGGETIVAGPWLGEVGFELLYWRPFLAWFAERFAVPAERLVVVSRGGVASWYSFAGEYREIFDYVSPEVFRQVHAERVAANGEQKQTRVLETERALLRTVAADVQSRAMLHPSTMYELFNPYWWQHLGTSWIHRHARYRPLPPPPAAEDRPAGPYVAVKFYFNECFPATEANRQAVRDLLRKLTARYPVVSLTTGLQLDDHRAVDVPTLGVQTIRQHTAPAVNLSLQSALVAGATAFVGTYGGFSYLAPFYGVRSLAFYDDPGGFSRRHLQLAQSAFAGIGAAGLLDVRPLAGADLSDID